MQANISIRFPMKRVHTWLEFVNFTKMKIIRSTEILGFIFERDDFYTNICSCWTIKKKFIMVLSIESKIARHMHQPHRYILHDSRDCADYRIRFSVNFDSRDSRDIIDSGARRCVVRLANNCLCLVKNKSNTSGTSYAKEGDLNFLHNLR